MITIFAAESRLDALRQVIQRVPRLEELVALKDFLVHQPEADGHTLMVKDKGIVQLLDWRNTAPPYLLPEYVAYSPANLLGLIFAKLGNYEEAEACLKPENPSLWAELQCVRALQWGWPLNPDTLMAGYSAFDEYRLMHNQAIVRHYAAGEEADFDLRKTLYFYQEALECAPNDEFKAFTVRHLATLLTDLGELDLAEQELHQAIEYALSDEARWELKHALTAVWMKQLTPPYDEALLASLKGLLWEVLQRYEQQQRLPEAGLLWLDAAHIANISHSFAEALGYVNRAIAIFEQETLPELLANAQYKRGQLLYTWAQNGNPQFYRGAMESFQQALRVFTREHDPATFADIHHHLGVVYSEIPDEAKKKSIWAAVSSASFKEALQFYTKEAFPYQYAMICNSYGNALTKYPAALHSDNCEKALFYYQEALDIRRPEAYPLERAITLLNYVEACWYLGHTEDRFDEDRYWDMRRKAEEALRLAQDPAMQETAQQHIDKLAELRRAYALPEI